MVDDQTATYRADRLRQIKEDHEQRIASSLQESTRVSGLPTIPPPTRDFTGRTQELEELSQIVGEQGGTLIYGVRGLGGIGKTQLGLKLVESIGADYPDGHILVELGGASDHPLSSADAMARVIRAYEPRARMPEAEEALHRFYHQVLKDRRAIVLLDDAAGAEQVEPLLPGTGCLTLVTSRRRFTLPTLHRLDLDTLTAEAARELLLSLAPRLGADAERLAVRLGRLPLALRLAGSAFAERPDLEPEEYLHRLENRDERVGLVEAAISFNYQALAAEQQGLWRALAVLPGGFDVAGAAAVWAVEADAAKEVLGGALYPVSLVEWRGGRYRLHDLARDFAASRLDGEEQRVAARRHAGHYAEVLKEAERLFHEGGEGLALFDREWQCIRAGQAWAAKHAGTDREAAEHCIAYSSAGHSCLNLRFHPSFRIHWFEAGLSAAEAVADRRGAGKAQGSLGDAHAELGEVDKAVVHYQQALVIAREIGDRPSVGVVSDNLGGLHTLLGEAGKAIGHYQQALVIAREIGDRPSVGEVLGNLGRLHTVLREMDKAIGHYQQALVIAREIGDQRGEGNALGNLGMAYAELGESEQAIGYYQQALAIGREIEDPRIVGECSRQLDLLRKS